MNFKEYFLNELYAFGINKTDDTDDMNDEGSEKYAVFVDPDPDEIKYITDNSDEKHYVRGIWDDTNQKLYLFDAYLLHEYALDAMVGHIKLGEAYVTLGMLLNPDMKAFRVDVSVTMDYGGTSAPRSTLHTLTDDEQMDVLMRSKKFLTFCDPSVIEKHLKYMEQRKEFKARKQVSESFESIKNG